MPEQTKKSNRKRITVIAKPTHECNFKCRYCYNAAENLEKGRMNKSTLRRMMERLASYFDEVKLIWHGGEPVLMGSEFYESVRDLQKEIDPKKFVNGIQTNASLLTEQLLLFFKKEDFNIGISIDGPKHLHDLTRIYPDGRGTFDDVMKSVNLMKEKSMRTGAICVLSKCNIGNIDEIYDFFKANQIGLKANPLVYSGRAKKNADLSITPLEYANAIIRLFHRTFFDESLKIDVDPIEDSIDNFLTNDPHDCTSTGNCSESYIGIDSVGDVYPCGRWTGLKEFRYGNINKNTMEDILESRIRQYLIKRKEVMNNGECNPCGLKELCNGGCMHNAYETTGNAYERDNYCEGYKMINDTIFKSVKDQLKLAAKEEL